MNHTEARPLLDAYLDGELDVVNTLALEQHVQSCEHCAAWLVDRRQLLAKLRAAPVRYAMPANVVDRVQTQFAIGSAKMRPGSLARMPSAIAAGVVLALSGFFLGQFMPRSPDLSNELVSASVRSVLSSHNVDVLSSDHHTVKPWLSDRLPYSPPVPELVGQSDQLLGGRIDVLNNVRVAALVYQHGKHQVNVFVWPSSALSGFVSKDVASDGYNITTTTVGDFAAALVSDMAVTELGNFRDRWRADAENRQ